MKKIIFLSVAILATGLLITPVFAEENTVSKAAIDNLRSQIEALKAKIDVLRSTAAGRSSSGGAAGGNSTVQAPSTSSGQATNVLPAAPAAVAVPVQLRSAVLSAPAIFDEDRSDDEIVQYNNLRVENVAMESSGTAFIAIITAASDIGVSCLKFQSESSGGTTAPCPVPPSILYSIRVDENTRLLLRNRAKATIKDFTVGDHINVYGFTDRDTGAIDALIVRNLDKPARKKFIQLNNAEVIAVPLTSELPATLVVVQRSPTPCLEYGEEGAGKSVPVPCPLGREKAVPQSSAAMPIPTQEPMATAAAYYMEYSVTVTSNTKLMDRVRSAISLKEVAIGDILNVYGTSDSFSAVISALIVRDLSKPVSQKGRLQVTVTDGSMLCAQPLSAGKTAAKRIAAPCGMLYDATVELYDSIGNLVGTGTTAKGVAYFDGLTAGTYTAVASAKGYETGKQTVSVKGAGVTAITIALKKETTGNTSPQIIGYPAIPTTIEPGQEVFFSWTAEDADGDSLSWNVSWGDGTGAAQPCPAGLESPGSWVWSGSHVWEKAGSYIVNATVNDCREGYNSHKFTIVIGSGENLPPVVSGISGPKTLGVGEAGTWTITASDPEGGQLSYSVYWGDEPTTFLGSTRTAPAQTATFTHSYAKAGIYNPTFTVSDSTGLGAKMSISVNVGATASSVVLPSNVNLASALESIRAQLDQMKKALELLRQ